MEASRRLDEPTGGVAHLISAISGKLPTMRRAGRALATDHPAITVNDRVVKNLLATRVRVGIGRLVVNIQLHGSGSDLSGVTIGLIARYGDDLHAEGDRVRALVGALLTETLGAAVTVTARENIRVRWQDIYAREWLN